MGEGRGWLDYALKEGVVFFFVIFPFFTVIYDDVFFSCVLFSFSLFSRFDFMPVITSSSPSPSLALAQ